MFVTELDKKKLDALHEVIKEMNTLLNDRDNYSVTWLTKMAMLLGRLKAIG